jgi:hypothetical protein
MSRGQLLNHIQSYERVEAWMPPDVSDRLRASRIAERDYQAEAEQHRAAGREGDALRTESIAAAFRAKAADYEQIDVVRREAEDRYADERDLANRSLQELERRGPAAVEQKAPDSESPTATGAQTLENEQKPGEREAAVTETERPTVQAPVAASRDESPVHEQPAQEPPAHDRSTEERKAEQTVEDQQPAIDAQLRERAEINDGLRRANDVAAELAQEREARERQEQERVSQPEPEIPDAGQSIEVE